MKQIDSVADGRRTNSALRGSSGASRAAQADERGEYGGMEGTSMVQRTFGNAAAGNVAGAKSITPGLSAKVFTQIVERGMRGDWGGVPEKKGAQGGSMVAQRSSASTLGHAGRIQRVMHSTHFDYHTQTKFGSDQPEAIYTSVADALRNLEAMPFNWVPQTAPVDQVNLMNQQWRARLKALRAIYKLCDQWTLTPESESSKGLDLIQYVMGELRDELSPKQPPTVNTAGTALGKTSNVTVDPTATLTPAQEKAIEVIDKTSLHKSRKEHSRDMIRNPEMIQQGAFGVCGATSMLYAVAKGTPVRFAEMIRDAWADSELVKKWLEVFYENADPRHIEIRSEVEYITAQWLIRKSQDGKGKGSTVSVDKEKVDYWYSIESQKSKSQLYKDVFDRQKEFSDSFEIEGWENTLGHFALTAGALSHLLNGLGTGKPSYKVKRKSFEQDFAFAKRLKGSNGSILASVTNTKFYEEGKDVSVDFYNKDGKTKGGEKPTFGPKIQGDTSPTPGPKYVHWVTLKDATLGTDGFYDLDIWTWGNNYKARVHKDVIYSHIYSLVVAQGKMW